jgi:hypothetical protein
VARIFATGPGKLPAKSSGTRNARPWAEYLLAILGGNIIFLLLEPHLPAAFQHQTFRVDWGLGLDFAICVGLLGLVRLARFLRHG